MPASGQEVQLEKQNMLFLKSPRALQNQRAGGWLELGSMRQLLLLQRPSLHRRQHPVLVTPLFATSPVLSSP